MRREPDNNNEISLESLSDILTGNKHVNTNNLRAFASVAVKDGLSPFFVDKIDDLMGGRYKEGKFDGIYVSKKFLAYAIEEGLVEDKNDIGKEKTEKQKRSVDEILFNRKEGVKTPVGIFFGGIPRIKG